MQRLKLSDSNITNDMVCPSCKRGFKPNELVHISTWGRLQVVDGKTYLDIIDVQPITGITHFRDNGCEE